MIYKHYKSFDTKKILPDIISFYASNPPGSDFDRFSLANKMISIKFCNKKMVFMFLGKTFLLGMATRALGYFLPLYPELLWFLEVSYVQLQYFILKRKVRAFK